MEKLKIKEAVIVEGKYDKNTLSQILDTLIIETNGFSIFNNKKNQNYIKKVAEEQGIIILTDSDSAGFMIRNHLKSFIDERYIKNCFIPQIIGKEKRKEKASSEGYLGVEGIDKDTLLDILHSVITLSNENSSNELTVSDLYELGYIGKNNSSTLRNELLQKLELPTHINNKDLLKYINKNEEVKSWLFKNQEKCI